MSDWRSRSIPLDDEPVVAEAPKSSWRDRAIPLEETPTSTPTSAPSALLSNFRNLLGGGDEIDGVAAAVQEAVLDGSLDGFGDNYRHARDLSRQKVEKARKDQPVASAIGSIGQGAALAPLIVAGGPLVAAATGGLTGGTAGFLSNDADLTDGVTADEALSYAKSTGVGTGLGAGMGALGAVAPAAASGLALTGGLAGKATGYLDDATSLELIGGGLIGLGGSAAKGFSNKIARTAGKEAVDAEKSVARQVAGHHDDVNRAAHERVKSQWEIDKAEIERLNAERAAKASQYNTERQESQRVVESNVAVANKVQDADYEARTAQWMKDRDAAKTAEQIKAQAARRAELQALLSKIDAEESLANQATEFGRFQNRESEAVKSFYGQLKERAKYLTDRQKLQAGHDKEGQDLKDAVERALAGKAKAELDAKATAQGELGAESKEAHAFMRSKAGGLGDFGDDAHAIHEQNLLGDYNQHGREAILKFKDGKAARFEQLFEAAKARNGGDAEAAVGTALAKLAEFEAQAFNPDDILAQVRRGPVPAEEAHRMALDLGLDVPEDPNAFRFWEKPELKLRGPRPAAPPEGPSRFQNRREKTKADLEALDAPGPEGFRVSKPEKPEPARDFTPELPKRKAELLDAPPAPSAPKPLRPRVVGEQKRLESLKSESDLPRLSAEERALIDSGVRTEVQASKPSETALQALLRYVTPKMARPDVLETKMPDAAVAKLGRQVERFSDNTAQAMTPAQTNSVLTAINAGTDDEALLKALERLMQEGK